MRTQGFSTFVRACAAIALVAALAGCDMDPDTSASTNRSDTDRPAVADKPGRPAFTKPEKPLPMDGAILWLASKSNTEILKGNISNGAYGTLRISVPSGNDAYFVKLREISPGSGDVFGTSGLDLGSF